MNIPRIFSLKTGIPYYKGVIVKMPTSKTYKLYRVWYRPYNNGNKSIIQNYVEEVIATTALKAKQEIEAKYPGCKATNAWPIKIIGTDIDKE